MYNRNRSALLMFFLFLLLGVMIVFQFLAMIQADRLYKRVERIAESLSQMPAGRVVSQVRDEDEFAGDEGDWVVWNMGAEPATLNPVTATDVYQSVVAGGRYGNIFESLLDYDPDTLDLKPVLAREYSVSDDGLEISFTLRDDVCFSDGVEVTVDDVIFSIETILNLEVENAARIANYYQDVNSWDKVSDKKIVFHMKKPYFLSLSTLGGTSIMPKHIYDFNDPQEFNKMRSDPVGSGPYVFEKWDVGSQIVLKRNENYWGRKPAVKKIIYKIITNETAALQAFLSGDVDVLSVTPEQFLAYAENEEFLKGSKALKYWSALSGYSYIGWNIDSDYFNDVRVRNAMTHLVDRVSINEHLRHGMGHIVTGPFYFQGKQYNQDIEALEFDIEKAKKLLDEAGWVDTNGNGIRDREGVEFSFDFMIVSGSPDTERIAKVLKEDFAKAGIEMKADPFEWSVFVDRLHGREFTATILGWGGTVEGDPYQIWHSSQTGSGGSNYIGFKNKEADDLIEQARKTLDEQKRNELYHRLHEILHEQQPYTFMFSSRALVFIDDRIENVKVTKLGLDPHQWYVPKDKQKYK